MPIYEYKCENCSNCFEKLVFSGDTESFECPECGSKQVRRMISCTNVFNKSSIGKCAAGAPGGYS